MLRYLALGLALLAAPALPQQAPDNPSPVEQTPTDRELVVRMYSCMMLQQAGDRADCFSDLGIEVAGLLADGEIGVARRLRDEWTARRPAPPPEPPPPPPASLWTSTETTDEIAQQTRLIVSRAAEQGRAGATGRERLFLRCQGGSFEIFVSWDFLLGSEAPRVEARLGNRPADRNPVLTLWSASANGQAIFSPAPFSLLNLLLQHDELALRVIPQYSNARTAVFDLRGLREASESMRQACPRPTPQPAAQPQRPAARPAQR